MQVYVHGIMCLPMSFSALLAVDIHAYDEFAFAQCTYAARCLPMITSVVMLTHTMLLQCLRLMLCVVCIPPCILALDGCGPASAVFPLSAALLQDKRDPWALCSDTATWTDRSQTNHSDHKPQTLTLRRSRACMPCACMGPLHCLCLAGVR